MDANEQHSLREVARLLGTIKIDDLYHTRAHDLVFVDSDETVEHTLNLMASKGVSCVPVHMKHRKDVMGIVDAGDIVSFTLGLFETPFKSTNGKTAIEERLKSAAIKFSCQVVSSVIDASRHDPHCPVFGGAPLSQLLEIMARGLHRVTVYSEDETRITKLVSQFDVIKYLSDNDKANKILQPITSKTLDELAMNDPELKFGREAPTTVLETASAAEGYMVIRNEKITAVGVVNAEGDLVGNLSASDLKGITSKTLGDLALPIKEYLAKYNRHTAPITVTLENTLADIMNLLVEKNIHRVWVVEKGQRKPVGVVTTTDVMNMLSFYTR
eukprot:GEZU01002522.1.p1 GENE.GEZU01002522.1~~GEZU01002522.1.p1  ORF type:complete len:328 (-),score=91.35 GEZU01002522.1:327-1310(-)